MDSDFRQILLDIIDSKLGSLSTEHLFLIGKFVTYYNKFSKKDLFVVCSLIDSFIKDKSYGSRFC